MSNCSGESVNNDKPDNYITVRLLMQGKVSSISMILFLFSFNPNQTFEYFILILKEVGSIIGKVILSYILKTF